jgi:hypothetical protein
MSTALPEEQCLGLLLTLSKEIGHKIVVSYFYFVLNKKIKFGFWLLFENIQQ